jgi:hypothetical protein
LVTALQGAADAAGRIGWDVSVDSTVMRAHQHAAGAVKRGTGNATFRADATASPTITHWVAPGAAGLPRWTWPASNGANPCPLCSPPGRAQTAHSSPRCSPVSGYPGPGRAEPGPAHTEYWPTRRTARGPIGSCCADVGSRPPSTSPPIKSAIASAAAALAADRRPSTARSTTAPRGSSLRRRRAPRWRPVASGTAG